MTSLLLRFEYKKVELLCQNLLSSGVSFLALLGVFSHHLKQALCLIEEKEASLKKESILALKIPQQIKENYQRYIRIIPKKIFLDTYTLCFELDYRFKSSSNERDSLKISELIEKLSAWKKD